MFPCYSMFTDLITTSFALCNAQHAKKMLAIKIILITDGKRNEKLTAFQI